MTRVAQRKSISGLRLWGLRCTERAAATSGSTSSHWDFSWTKSKRGRKERGVIGTFQQRSRCLHSQFLGYLCELAGGQRRCRCLWNHTQKKLLGRAQDLKRLHLTMHFRRCVRKKIDGIKWAWDFSHLVVGELARRFELKAIQVKLQQLHVGEDGCVQEAWAACSTELQLRA